MYYDTLRKDLFAAIDYPKDLTALIGEAEPWRGFCTLPREMKERYSFLNHQQYHDPGYRFRSKAEGREDKEYFHLYPDTYELIAANGLTEEVRSEKKLSDFFSYADKTYHAAHEFAMQIGRDMGREIPELGRLVEEGKVRSTLRFLHYLNGDDTDVIAAQHFDRSLYTLHLYESGPGLQFMNWDMQWTDAPIDIGKTVVFSGYRLEKLTEGKIQKTWHRVARKDEVKGRVSMVLFVWTREVEDYPREARSQDMTPSYAPLSA
ncbi:MAG TPA: 2OG-Fe(II) oxygenase family protein [Candidatus Paceibacterota bacterium]|nr:2OG-Fe(II) oxygenase family protein [Candidatus Paceibacterota bacterium]